MHLCPEHQGPLVVETRHLRVTLAGRPVLDGVNFKVPKGQLVALIGPNGSGKTTLLRCLLGLQKPSSGEIRLFEGTDIREALPRIGYVPQRIDIERSFILSVREFLALRMEKARNWFWHAHKTSDEMLGGSLAEIGVQELLDRPLAHLSGGQLQRV